MTYDTQPCRLIASIFLSAIFLQGCGADNQQNSRITGKVDTGAAANSSRTPKEAKAQFVIPPNVTHKNYPAPVTKGR